MRPARARAILAECPKCGAPPGFPCVGKKGERKAPHQSRFRASAAPLPKAPKPVLRVVKPAPASFYDTDEWRRLRYRALKIHGGACQCCGATPTRGKPLHVDHIKPRSKFPELALDLNNLQVLCDDCNLGKGAWDQTDWRPEGEQ